MNGIELAKSFYQTYGIPMLEKEFSGVKNRIAAGLVGHGSECFGFDDAVSRDHDYEPGFCLWITEEDEREFGFRLFRAYSKLPDEFMGVKMEKKSVLGSQFKGVHTIEEFYSFYLGKPALPATDEEWLSIPSFYLAEATNGEVFADDLGKFSELRRQLLQGYPQDVFLKKTASAFFNMAQAGQYNYARCFKHGERLAASVALSEFVRQTASAAFLLAGKYEPYYKWTFRALGLIPEFSFLVEPLEKLMSAPFDGEKNLPVIEKIAGEFITRVQKIGLCKDAGDYLEPYAYALQNRISSAALRNSPVML